MSERREYEMTQEQVDILLSASQPVPYMVIGGVAPDSPQERANREWKLLGEQMGFQWDTVRPIDGKSMNFFTAEPKT